MHHYPHHIGDYRTHTAHLTMLEDGAYRRLMDLYYMHEQPLPVDVATVRRLAAARTREERAAVDAVLREFFTLEEDGWHQSRCDEELSSYRARGDTARENGRNGGRPKTQTKPGRKPADNQPGFSRVSKTRTSDNPDETRTEPEQKLTVNREPVTIGAPPKGAPPDEHQKPSPVAAHERLEGAAHDTASVLARLGGKLSAADDDLQIPHFLKRVPT